MNKILGLGVTGLSVVLAAIVSGLRLKPYLDAGETYTPPTFALYPALIAVALTVPAVFILRKWQGKTNVDIGPVTFTDKQPFLVLGCLLYVLVALLFFPYQKPPTLPFPAQPHSPEKSVTPRQPVRVPLLFR
jgi:hypothetical protein